MGEPLVWGGAQQGGSCPTGNLHRGDLSHGETCIPATPPYRGSRASRAQKSPAPSSAQQGSVPPPHAHPSFCPRPPLSAALPLAHPALPPRLLSNKAGINKAAEPSLMDSSCKNIPCIQRLLCLRSSARCSAPAEFLPGPRGTAGPEKPAWMAAVGRGVWGTWGWDGRGVPGGRCSTDGCEEGGAGPPPICPLLPFRVHPSRVHHPTSVLPEPAIPHAPIPCPATLCPSIPCPSVRCP